MAHKRLLVERSTLRLPPLVHNLNSLLFLGPESSTRTADTITLPSTGNQSASEKSSLIPCFRAMNLGLVFPLY